MDELREVVMRKYYYTCVWPDCWQPAACMHEEPPRSLKRRVEETMWPLCLEHHEYATAHRGPETLSRLREGAAMVLEFYED